MGSDVLKSFLQSIRTKPELLTELRPLLRDPEAAIRWAEVRGYHLTSEDIVEIYSGDPELSDEELDKVAGGDDAWPPPPPPPKD